MSTNQGMCVSVDPGGGYRWNTRYCNGPDKATFLCQIPGKSTWDVIIYFKNLNLMPQPARLIQVQMEICIN